MKNGLRFFVLLILATQLSLYANGCTGLKMRNVNVKAGEYYSEDEYDLLSASERTTYCGELDAELAASQQVMEARQTEIRRAKDSIQSIRRQIVPIEQEVLRLESDIRSLSDQIKTVKSLPTEWKVKAGDSLSLISMKKKIYNDIEKWWRILEANRDKIEDPYYIFPDTVLVVPRDWPTD